MNSMTLKDLRVPVEVVLGGTELTAEQLAGLGEGTIVELTSIAGEPVELKATGETIARGEVVIIDENFGIRITSIVGTGE